MKTFKIKHIIPITYCDICKKVLRRSDRYVIFETNKFPLEIKRTCIKCLEKYIEKDKGG